MKKIFLLLLIIPLFSYSQNKNLNETFQVNGNCEMCKKRIEKATLSLNGVKYSNWNNTSSNLSIIFNKKKITIDEIKNKIAESGHDNGDYISSLESYNKLPDCCKYRDTAKH